MPVSAWVVICDDAASTDTVANRLDEDPRVLVGDATEHRLPVALETEGLASDGIDLEQDIVNTWKRMDGIRDVLLVRIDFSDVVENPIHPDAKGLMRRRRGRRAPPSDDDAKRPDHVAPLTADASLRPIHQETAETNE